MVVSKTKKRSKTFVERVKKLEQDSKKGNVTFRLNLKVHESFRIKCQNEEVSMARIVEELMQDFVEDNS